MPFPVFIYLNHKITTKKITNCQNVINTSRKEGRIYLTREVVSCITEKASVSASVTVEAVFCVPLFFYAAVCLIWMLEIRAVQSAVKCGMQEVGKRTAVELYEMPVLLPAKLEADIVNSVGSEWLDGSLVAGGSGGIHCEKSYVIPGSGIMELKVSYQIRLPFPIFAIPALKYQESMRIKGWTGYFRQGFSESKDRTIVYITETGVVYHMDYHCTYLEPSVRVVTADNLQALRNENGGKYHACERCMSKGTEKGSVYITDYGNRYHSTLGCSGLKRKIYAVPIEDAKGKGACSKCGK